MVDLAILWSCSAWLANAEILQIQKVLNYTNGNNIKTASLLNIALTTLNRKIVEYRL
ncbi:MAG: hypothetical protein JXR61_00790 [Prolixibacteraceae bacterium]|nr:hypothetical protein [Prolixibacteraceae bacterium]